MSKLMPHTLASVLVAAALFAVPAAAREPVALGAPAPAFTLPDATSKETVVLKDAWSKSKLTVLLFIATQCPVSKAYDARMAQIARDYEKRGVRFLGVNSNKQEAAAEIAAHAKANGFSFPVLKDDKNVVADAYGASVTPEVFIIDGTGVVRYRGRIDENKEDAAAVKSPDLRNALDALLAGKQPERADTKAFGCSIKRL